MNPFIRLRRDLVSQTHTPLLYAETDARETGYLRTTVLDQFRDSEWRPSPRVLPSENKADGAVPQPAWPRPGHRRQHEQWDLRLAPDFGTTWLPLPYPIRKLEVRGSWRYDSRTLDVAYVGGSSPAELAYEATSFTPNVTAALLNSAPPPPTPAASPSMTDLPDNLPDVVAERAREVTQDATTDYQKAVALQDWFRQDGGFTYSLEQRSGSGMDLLADFITDDRIGYCEQFAAAMAAMGRSLGIPSRVVVGFLDGETLPDGRILYTSDDRHAWPEMYFAGVGWVRFEPTPSQRAGATPPWTRQDIERPRARPPRRSATSAPSQAPDADSTRRRTAPTPATAGSRSRGGRSSRSVRCCWSSLSVRAPSAARNDGDASRARDPVHLAEGAWAELHATALDLGLDWPEQRSPREQARQRGRARSRTPRTSAVSSLEGLLVQVERGRYGPTRAPVTATVDPEERSRTVETVESWRHAMLDSVDRRRGWQGRLWPVSLLRGSAAARAA